MRWKLLIHQEKHNLISSETLTKEVTWLRSTFGLMELLEWEQKAELLLKKFLRLLIFQNGTMMDHPHIKPLLRALRSLLSLFSISQILSEEETISWYCARLFLGLMVRSKNWNLVTQISEIMQKKFLITNQRNSHGLELSRNIFCLNKAIIFRLAHMDGQILVSQESKDLTIAQLEEMLTLVETLLMLTTNVVYMQELKSQVQMLRYFLDNGNFKLDHASELNKETIFGLPDISCKDALKNTTFQLVLNQKFFKTGMDLDATPIIPQR